jgi:hypothetical protein
MADRNWLARYKKKLIALFVVVVVLTAIQQILPYSPAAVAFYNEYIFAPLQVLRTTVLGFIPLSIGDIIYILGGILLLVTIGKWIYYLAKFKNYKHQLFHSLLNFVIIVGVVYVVFLIGWGGNYYKQSLTNYWELDRSGWADTTTLVAFDESLIAKLNSYAPAYRALGFKETEKRAITYYRRYTDSKTKQNGINTKSSVFGNLMEYLAVQGYYNPFTGEAQVNKHLPSFMLPYVVCHEMAHQCGIAAEDDANLLAYVLATEVNDVSFNYSACFNAWLYTHSRLKAIDSNKANELKKKLNPLSVSHVDTLRQLRMRYRSMFSKYSGQFYDYYLKFHKQEQGIHSYNYVTVSAWAWEQRMSVKTEKVIHIP